MWGDKPESIYTQAYTTDPKARLGAEQWIGGVPRPSAIAAAAKQKVAFM